MLQTTKSRLLHDSFRRYLRMSAWEHIDKVIAKTRDEELAPVLAGFSEDSQRAIFERLPNAERKANVIVQMEPPFGTKMLEPMAPPAAALILREMATDDATDIIADLPDDQASQILESIDAEDKAEVETLLEYEEDSAGGLMQLELISARPNETTTQVIARIRAHRDEVGDVANVFVIDEERRVVGVAPLQLSSSPARTTR